MQQLLPAVVVGPAAGIRGAQFLEALERGLPERGFAYQPGGRGAVQGLASKGGGTQAAAGQQVARRARRARLDHQPTGAQVRQPARERRLADSRAQPGTKPGRGQAFGVGGEQRQQRVFKGAVIHPGKNTVPFE